MSYCLSELGGAQIDKRNWEARPVSPEERFQIGRYATDHGIAAATRYFSSTHSFVRLHF